MLPSTADRLKQATDNEAFATAICDGIKAHFGWAITSLYYALVQVSRAYLASAGRPAITSHSQFQSEFVRTTGDAALYALYREMQDSSEEARYDCNPFSLAEVQQLRENVYRPCKEGMVKLIQALSPKKP